MKTTHGLLNNYYLVITHRAADKIREIVGDHDLPIQVIRDAVCGAIADEAAEVHDHYRDQYGNDVHLVDVQDLFNTPVRMRINLTDQDAPDGQKRVAFLCKARRL